MNNIIDFTKIKGPIRPMNAVNNGPIHKISGGQHQSNLKDFQELCIPYARTHDAALYNTYGLEHVVDISAIFPDFNADPYKEESYDFVVTDAYLNLLILAGAEPFYRLGYKIEHWVKKFNVWAPKDFKKWAIICEHIILHYNYKWNNGFEMGIKYWEIWNEPDIDGDNPKEPRCWGGTYDQFYEFFTTVLEHLKGKFPHLMIGGPAAVCVNPEFEKPLLRAIKAKNLKLDFFSWHTYASNPRVFGKCAKELRDILDSEGFTDTLSICDEWNYVDSWSDGFVDSVKTIISMKGAAYIASAMTMGMENDIDLLMYYDMSPCIYNGLFDYYTQARLKGYYTFKIFNEVSKNKNWIETNFEDDNIYALGTYDKEGTIMITGYDNDNDFTKDLSINIKGYNGEFDVYTLNDDYNMELTNTLKVVDGMLNLTITSNTVLLLRTK